MENNDLFIQNEEYWVGGEPCDQMPLYIYGATRKETTSETDYDFFAKNKFIDMLQDAYDAIELVSLKKGYISKQEAKYYFDKYTKLDERLSKLPKSIVSSYELPYHKDPQTYDTILNVMEHYKLLLLDSSTIDVLREQLDSGECTVYNDVYQPILVKQIRNEAEQEEEKEL